MSRNQGSQVHLAIYETLADWEVGHLLAELRTGRFTGRPAEVVAVAEDTQPVTTMGGVHWLPDIRLADLDPEASDLLILPGADLYDRGELTQFAESAKCFLEAGVPVAAICGATAGLARAGVLDRRPHTSNAAGYLTATGYAGGEHYLDQRVVVDGDLITAGSDAPVQFAIAGLKHLGLMDDAVGEAYEAVMHRGEAEAFPVLMGAAA